MDSMIAKLRVALQLDSAAFESGTTRAANQVNALGINMATAQAKMASFSEGLILSSGAAQRAGQSMRAVNDNAGAMRAGLQSAGFQLQDMAVQFASGQRAGVIFAQQLPQLSGALSQMAAAAGTTSGVVGRLAGFMAGPWGVAVGIGVAVLSPLVAKLFETKEAADAAKGGLYDLINAQRKLAAERLKPTMSAIELNKLRDERLSLSTKLDLPVAKGFNEQFEKQNRPFYQKRLRELEMQIAEGQAALNAAEAAASPLTAPPSSRATSGGRGFGGGGSARSAGQSAAREYRSGAEDELSKLQQTTNDILASFKPFGDRTAGQFAGRADTRLEALRTELGDVSIAMEKYGIEATDTNREVGDSFQQMANESLNALRQLTSGIQSGDILGILGGLVNALAGLGKTGLLGKGLQASVKSFQSLQGRASGGPVSANTAYMVGERGPELFIPGGSGSIVPNHKMGGSMQVQVVPSPYFDVRVLQNVGSVAPIIANAGADLGNSRMAKAGRRRLA
jgi:hypothetical protein